MIQGMITVASRPDPLELDEARAVVLVIEMLFGWVSNSHALIGALMPSAKLASAQ